MTSAAVLVAAMALGIDVGWQPLPDGGMEYIIQIEPFMLDALKSGEEFYSDVPAQVRGIRSYRILVGNETLPRVDPPPEPAPAATEVFPNLGGRFPYSPLAPEPIVPSVSGEFRPPYQSEPTLARPMDSTGAARPTMRLPTPRPDTPTPGGAAPQTLHPPANTRPLAERTAAFIDTVDTVETGEASPSEQPPAVVGPPAEETPAKPWFPFTLAMAGCISTSAGMLYFGVVAWDYRKRYQGLLAQVLSSSRLSESVAAGDAAVRS